MATEIEEKEVFAKDFHFASDNDKILGVETAIYNNGNEVRRITLSTGKVAVIRELSGEEMINVNKMLNGVADNYGPAIMHFSVKIDGQQIPMEDYPKMKGKDFNKINLQIMDLNF